MMIQISSLFVVTIAFYPGSAAFAPSHRPVRPAFRLNLKPITQQGRPQTRGTRLNYIDERTLNAEETAAVAPVAEAAAAAAPLVDSAQLEALIMDEWEEGPLVVNVFARWAGPCRRMSEDYDAAARELSGKVRMVKFDVDADRDMARRLDVSQVPTLLFLDSYDWDAGHEEGKSPTAVLKKKMHGLIEKDALKAQCEQLYFNVPTLV